MLEKIKTKKKVWRCEKLSWKGTWGFAHLHVSQPPDEASTGWSQIVDTHVCLSVCNVKRETKPSTGVWNVQASGALSETLHEIVILRSHSRWENLDFFFPLSCLRPFKTSLTLLKAAFCCVVKVFLWSTGTDVDNESLRTWSISAREYGRCVIASHPIESTRYAVLYNVQWY